MIQGFGEEEIEELGAYALYIGVDFDFFKIGASVIIMSTIGAITDTAVAISSPMREAFHHQPSISRKELFTFGLGIGKDIFRNQYEYIILCLLDLSYSVGEIFNSKIFSAEMITIFCSGMGVALVIPITAWITAYSWSKQKEKRRQ